MRTDITELLDGFFNNRSMRHNQKVLNHELCLRLRRFVCRDSKLSTALVFKDALTNREKMLFDVVSENQKTMFETDTFVCYAFQVFNNRMVLVRGEKK